MWRPLSKTLAINATRIYYASRDPEALLFRFATRYGLEKVARWLVRHPVTFNQHVRRRMMYTRDPIYIRLADKLECKTFVAERLGDGHTPLTFTSGTKSAEIDWKAVPREYAIKVNHASGGVILVAEHFPRGSTLPEPGSRFDQYHLNPDDVDLARLEAVIDEWLAARYGNLKGEWAYSKVSPKVFVEEYMRTPESAFPPPDYKFFVFNGKCAALRMDKFDNGGKSRYHFDREGRFMPVRIGEFGKPLLPMNSPIPDLPATFRRMREMAEVLGSTLDFVRVDMFETNGRIFVGEMTLYPTAGAARFVPRSYDRWLGEAWSRAEKERLLDV